MVAGEKSDAACDARDRLDRDAPRIPGGHFGIRRGFDLAYRMGDFTYAAYSWDALTSNYLTAGDPLAETQLVAEKGVAFAKSAGFGFVVDACAAMLLLVRSLRGLTPVFGRLGDHEFNEYEADAERRLRPGGARTS